MTDLYKLDFVLWSEQTAQHLRDVTKGDLPLRARIFDKVDWENVIEEIESLGRSDKRALFSQSTRVIMHLLRWDFQQDRRSNSWQLSIVEGRIQIRQLIEDSPSLKNYLLEILPKCYQDAVKLASTEIDSPIKVFPVECPYTIEEVLSADLLLDSEQQERTT